MDTTLFGCDLSSKTSTRICHIRTDANGQFQFNNIAFAKYKLTAKLEKENLIFTMQPSILSVDLTKHQDISLIDSFKLDKVSIKSQILLAANVSINLIVKC